MNRRALAALLLAVTAGALLQGAKKRADAPPTFADDFSAAAPGPKWATPKGEWRIEDGALVGRELSADKHAAVLTLAIPNKDSHLRFRFQLDGAQGFNLSMNHAKGHLFRVHFKPEGLAITTDKVKNDPASKIETVAKAAGSFEAGRWYTVDVEMAGGHVRVRTGNGLTAQGSHPALDTAKPNYRFVMRDGALRLDDVAVWMGSAK